jgi:hypothetical protein
MLDISGCGILLRALWISLCMRSHTDHPLYGYEYHAQQSNWPLLLNRNNRQSRKLPCKHSFPSVQLRHVLGDTGRCCFHELEGWPQDFPRHVLVRRRWYSRMALCCCALRALHAGGAHLACFWRQDCAVGSICSHWSGRSLSIPTPGTSNS